MHINLLEEKAKSLDSTEIISLLEDLERKTDELTLVKRQAEMLKIQLAWYEKQFHGSKSEKDLDLPVVFQVPLGAEILEDRTPTEIKADPTEENTKREAKNHKKSYPGTPSYAGLRFNESKAVIEDVIVPAEGIEGLSEGEYEVISTKVTCKITRQTSYKVIRYFQDVIKIKSSNKIVSGLMPDTIFSGSYADLDLVVGMLIDKFKYHLPLYRQKHMMEDAGIFLPRSTLSNWVIRGGGLLKPIYEELLKSIKESRVISMDEVPIRVGSSKGGGIKKNYIWPIYGERDEVGFVYTESRASSQIEAMLGLEHGSNKVLLTDGYAAYKAYKNKVEAISQAYCWAHVRRKFVEALQYEGEPCGVAISLIGKLYGIEKEIREFNKNAHDQERIFRIRQERSKPVVDEFFHYLNVTLAEGAFLPSSPLVKARDYALKLEDGLRLFLDDPEVPIDNNHTERAIRSIVLGRKNWLFCWSEVGAQTLAIIQSLISSCVIQKINPREYLKDVFERISDVKTKDIRTLIPREWKIHYSKEVTSV